MILDAFGAGAGSALGSRSTQKRQHQSAMTRLWSPGSTALSSVQNWTAAPGKLTREVGAREMEKLLLAFGWMGQRVRLRLHAEKSSGVCVWLARLVVSVCVAGLWFLVCLEFQVDVWLVLVGRRCSVGLRSTSNLCLRNENYDLKSPARDGLGGEFVSLIRNPRGT